MASSIDLHPPIHWGQTPQNVSMRIGLTDVKYPKVEINESSINFQATGCSGSRGEQLYSFEIELFDKIDSKASTYKINDREINVNLKKIKTDASSAWPRLTKSSAKLPWLKADFDKMTYSEDESDHEKKKPMFDDRFNDDIYKSFRQDMRQAKAKESGKIWMFVQGFLDLRTNWLLFYNLFQFMAYLWVFTRLLMHFTSHGHLKNGYRLVENPIKLCQALAVLEIVHPLIGFTKGDWLSPFLQFIGRNLILFVVINYNNQIKPSPIISYLFLVWSFVELFRYPYYGIRLLNKQNRVVTWLRYTLWIVLYPLGALLEGCLVFQSLQYYHSNRYFSIDLPNRFNFSFSFAFFLSFYLIILPLGLLHMMRYMWSQRKKLLLKKNN